MKLSDVKPSISQMSDEESFALIQKLRFLRRQRPEKKQGKKKSTVTVVAKKKPVSTKAALKKLSKEDRLKLIAELEGMD